MIGRSERCGLTLLAADGVNAVAQSVAPGRRGITGRTPHHAPPCMRPDRLLRGALWTSVALNALGVAVFAPLATGHASPLLPVPPSPFLAGQVGFVIALFGGVYFWLARQPLVYRPLLVVGGLGKTGFFGLAVAYAIAGDVPMQVAVGALPDLVLGAIFLRAARATPRDS